MKDVIIIKVEGHAGTGKTLILKALQRSLRDLGIVSVLVAPINPKCAGNPEELRIYTDDKALSRLATLEAA